MLYPAVCALLYKFLPTKATKEKLLEQIDRIDQVLCCRMNDRLKLMQMWTMLHGEDDESIRGRYDALYPLSQLKDWLGRTVLEKAAVTAVIQRQQAYNLQNLTPADPMIVSRLREMSHSPWTLEGGDSESLISLFWALYHACEDNALAAFNACMDVSELERPISHLVEYNDLLTETCWERPHVVLDAAVSLVSRQLNIIIQQHQSYSFHQWYSHMRRFGEMWEQTYPAL